ncbi:hypothetical protein EHQ53_04735 [Leptospira langatensis]|uniref:Lipoprotein n=1 Tax=Leptospira langatensis TaxID=2484983 RepID=A0A5F1ZYE5_9LEPT|nr:hypothetical protein [Leptospira langatensis]TGK00126.1 hypothetical protein EHO57_12600 [Leptospira langatensis]TGL42760.1 hypothetical protein EHQ53_04735 [Leptospira langatensis]
MKRLLLLVPFLILDCGFKPVPPPAGKFCEPMLKETQCITLDFRKGKAYLAEKEYPMKSTSILNYSYTVDGVTYELEVLNENRVKIVGTNGFNKTLLKLKDKDERKKEWAKLWEAVKGVF